MPQLHSQLKQPRASIRSEEQLSVIATVTELALINPHNARAYLRLDSTTSFLSPYSHCQYLFSILVQAVCLLSWRFLILTQPPHFPSLCYPSSYFSPTFGFFPTILIYPFLMVCYTISFSRVSILTLCLAKNTCDEQN